MDAPRVKLSLKDPDSRFDFMLNSDHPAYKSRTAFGSPGGFGTMYLYVVDDVTDDVSRQTRYAVKVIHPLSVKDPKNMATILMVWNEWVSLRHLQFENLVVGLALRTQPPLPVNIIEAMTLFVARHLLKKEDISTEIERLMRMFADANITGDLQMAIAMEHFESVSLRAFLAKNEGKLPYVLFRSIIYQTMNALRRMHDADILHLDMKPDNLLIKPSSSLVKICDYGAVGHKLHIAKHYASTAGYAAPERARNPTTKSDVFSMGKTILRLSKLVCWYKVKAKLVHQWTALVDSMTHKDPNQRPELSEILDDTGQGDGHSSLFLGINRARLKTIAHADLLRVTQQYHVRYIADLKGTALLRVFDGAAAVEPSDADVSFLDAIPPEFAEAPECVVADSEDAVANSKVEMYIERETNEADASLFASLCGGPFCVIV